MGLLGKIAQKMGDAMEKAAVKNMTGESKEAYEKEKLAREEARKNMVIDELIEFKFEKDDLKDLETLLMKAKLIDDQNIWIAGLPNFKTNQSAVTANLFSGKKNLRFFTVNQELYYFVHFQDNYIKAYKVFRKPDIKYVESKTKLVGADTLKIELKDGKVFTIAVTENKEQLKSIKTFLNV